MTTRLAGGASLSERLRAEQSVPLSIQRTTGCPFTWDYFELLLRRDLVLRPGLEITGIMSLV